MARDTVKMLVLETDAPHPDTNENRGGFSYMLNDLFTKAGNNHDPPLGIKTDTHFVVDDPVSQYLTLCLIHHMSPNFAT